MIGSAINQICSRFQVSGVRKNRILNTDWIATEGQHWWKKVDFMSDSDPAGRLRLLTPLMKLPLFQKCRAGHRASQSWSARWPTLREHKTKVSSMFRLAACGQRRRSCETSSCLSSKKIEHRTSNVERPMRSRFAQSFINRQNTLFDVRRSVFDVRCSLVSFSIRQAVILPAVHLRRNT